MPPKETVRWIEAWSKELQGRIGTARGDLPFWKEENGENEGNEN